MRQRKYSAVRDMYLAATLCISRCAFRQWGEQSVSDVAFIERLDSSVIASMITSMMMIFSVVLQRGALEQPGVSTGGSFCRRAKAGDPDCYIVQAELAARGNFRASDGTPRIVSNDIGSAGKDFRTAGPFPTRTLTREYVVFRVS